MKKGFLALAAVAMLFATSCTKESVNPAVDIPEGSFLATIDNGANPQNAPVVNDGMSTKTNINGDNYVIWDNGDQIAINGSIYTTSSTPGSTVVFSGGSATGSTFHAFYPATIAGTDNAGTLPATQTYVTNKVSNLPMYACSTTNQLTFKNICAALKITIPAFVNGATSIVVSSNERMNGAFTIVGDSAKMDAAPSADADKKVTIAKSSGSFATGEVVYIAVPAQAYTDFKVEFFNGQTSMWNKTLQNTTLRVNKVYNINATPMALCFTARNGSVTVKFKIKSGMHQIQTSIDGGASWQNYNSQDEIILAANAKVYFQAATDQTTANAFGTTTYSTSSFFTFTSTNGGTVEASGNIMSLYGPSCPDLPLDAYAFAQMFQNCSKMTTAPELPAGTLKNNCYQYMFSACTSLLTAPKLPAETLKNKCYQYMFNGCTSLLTAPELPAETLENNCYYWMFNGCTSLRTAPALPAETLSVDCYSNMFFGCTSLLTAPELPAETMRDNCYSGMFQSCTSLRTAPELPAETLAGSCYKCMFKGCTSLQTAPALPAETLADLCYQYMFHSCTSLQTAPALPAETLANLCYQYMFQGCTSLQTAPALPAETLANSCYQYMFQGCTSLSKIEVAFTTWDSSTNSKTRDWTRNVAASGTFVKPLALSETHNDATNFNAIPAGWTVQNK